MNIDYSPSFEDILISDIRDWGIDNIENSFSISLTDLTDKYWESQTSVWDSNELELILEAEGSEPFMYPNLVIETTCGEQPEEVVISTSDWDKFWASI